MLIKHLYARIQEPHCRPPPNGHPSYGGTEVSNPGSSIERRADLGEAAEMRLPNNGTGIAPEIRDKLFQHFVTTKPTASNRRRGDCALR
jgi:hypothetical protein